MDLSVSFQTVITIIGFRLNNNNKQEIAQKTQTNVTTHTFFSLSQHGLCSSQH